MGQGPRTGRAAGLCSGSDVPGFMSAPGGRGGWGGWGGRGGRRGGWRGFVPRWMGWGRGWRWSDTGPSTDADELAQRADMLEAELEAIRKQLASRQPKTDGE